MAARFGATIVPFAAIGADESISQILDGAQVQQLNKQLGPLLGRPAQDPRQARIPRARVGVNATMEDVEAFSLVSWRVVGHVSAGLIGGPCMPASACGISAAHCCGVSFDKTNKEPNIAASRSFTSCFAIPF